jgi:hypothetical protein
VQRLWFYAGFFSHQAMGDHQKTAEDHGMGEMM